MTSSNPDLSLSLTLSSSTPNNEERGVKLIQLLLKCAHHTSSGNLHRADECLSRISQLASVTGDSMQRLAARFASALAVRLVKSWPGLYKALNRTEPTGIELDRARSVFAEAFPYLGFTYAVITRTLIHTMTRERNIHIVDLGSGDPKLWVPFLRSFSNGLDGPPFIKLTCVNTNQFVLDKLGIKLCKEAKSLAMAFEFNPINVRLIDLKLEMLKVRSNEALAFTSILNLHVLLSQNDKQIEEFLVMVRSMSPKVMLLVEQESDHNSNRLIDRFVEGLHYYSALFDAVNSICRKSFSSEERIVVEEMFGREIENIVACEGLERVERHEKYVKWTVRFCNAKFRPVRLWNMEEAARIVEAYGSNGYKIIDQKASLMICWHDRPIYFVSAWI